jgi:hypothetical protein
MRRFIVSLLFALPLSAFAADRPKDLQPLPDLPPPPPGVMAGDDEPQITIQQRSEGKVEEYRIRGKLYMMKITPKIGKPYYLIDQRGDGNFIRQGSLDSGLRPPMWVIKQW